MMFISMEFESWAAMRNHDLDIDVREGAEV